MARMKLIEGHQVGDEFYPFPHLCPEPQIDCAIFDFLRHRHRRKNIDKNTEADHALSDSARSARES